MSTFTCLNQYSDEMQNSPPIEYATSNESNEIICCWRYKKMLSVSIFYSVIHLDNIQTDDNSVSLICVEIDIEYLCPI